jgi:hypothetical protein
VCAYKHPPARALQAFLQASLLLLLLLLAPPPLLLLQAVVRVPF